MVLWVQVEFCPHPVAVYMRGKIYNITYTHCRYYPAVTDCWQYGQYLRFKPGVRLDNPGLEQDGTLNPKPLIHKLRI